MALLDLLAQEGREVVKDPQDLLVLEALTD